MAAESSPTFISYSREDREFALKLTEDLKAANANVWLDQLDIELGERWARAVQTALNNAPRVLVIVSPASANSTNVENEVAFALEKRKTVIPVFYRECEVPLQLLPLQYVDFRTDYARGLGRLLKTLGASSPSTMGAAAAAAPAPAALPISTAETVEREQQATAAERARLEEERERKVTAEKSRQEDLERQRVTWVRKREALVSLPDSGELTSGTLTKPSPSGDVQLQVETSSLAPPRELEVPEKIPEESYIYALGRVEAHFPSPGVEKEFMRAANSMYRPGLSDRQIFQELLTQPESHTLIVRELCWVWSISGYPAYILRPHDPSGFQMLAKALQLARNPDVVIGTRGPIAPREMCKGLMLPMVEFDRLYSFDPDSFIKFMPRPQRMSKEKFQAGIQEVSDRIMQFADNAGATDEDRAVNFLVVSYSAIYSISADAYWRGLLLQGIEGVPSRGFTGDRRVVDVILSYAHRHTGSTEEFGAKVDVTEKLPFINRKLLPYR